MNAEMEIAPLDRARVFIGRTSADEGFSTHTHVIREIALQGCILPRQDYDTFIALYPTEGKHNRIARYETRILSASEDTVPVAALRHRIDALTIPTNGINPHVPQSHIDQPMLRHQFELAAARLRQPSIILALGKNGKSHNISLFFIEGMTPDHALSLMQRHLRSGAKKEPHRSKPSHD